MNINNRIINQSLLTNQLKKMKENQKDSLTTGSQGQQTQASQYNSTKVGTPSPKQGARDEEDEEEEQPQAGTKQYESKEQRDTKTSPQ